MTAPMTQPAEAWLEEPKMPKPEDFKDPVNYEFATEQYKKKMETYQARLNLRNACKEYSEEDKRALEYEALIKTIAQDLGVIDWCYPKEEDDNGNPLPFKASKLANTILARNEYKIITDKKSEVIYLWVEKIGTYLKFGEQYLRFLIDNVLGEESTSHHINETIELIKIRTYASPAPSKNIAVLNGILDITTGHIKPFTKYDFITNKLNVEYIEGVKSEAWLKFIDQVVPDDKQLLQQWSGYLLIKGYPFHAIMWLYGPKGRNGKGCWARTMESILGVDNYSAVSIDQFDGKHRFAIFNLHDSLFNICSEPRTDRQLTVEQLQMLTGMDAVDAERKGIQEPFKMFNEAKMTVMGNKFPRVEKPTDAFWERLKLIKFPNSFTGVDQIQNLEENWLNDPIQRAAVLNWMIEGAQQLLTQHDFIMTRTQKQVIIQFKRATDSIGAFIDECLEIDAKSIVTHAVTSDYYKTYCELIDVPADSSTALNKRLNDTANIKNTSKRLGIEKTKTKVWQGFKLKDLPETDKDEEETEDNDIQTELPMESGTDGTSGTAILSQEIFEKSTENLEYAKKLVPAVPVVPLVPSEQLSVVVEESGLRHIEVNKDLVTRERVEAAYNLILEKQRDLEGPVPIADISDKDAFTVLLKEGRIFNSNIDGYVGVS